MIPDLNFCGAQPKDFSELKREADGSDNVNYRDLYE